MPIITVSRGSFSGGKMLAEAVAHKLGYRCIDRDEIVQKAAAWGVSEENLHAALEKPPAFFGQSPQTKFTYLAFVQAALTEEVRNGKAVYHGLAGHLLLGRGPHVLRTRIIAPMEFRIQKVQERLKCSRDEAIAYIEKRDDDRRKWTKFLYNVDWTDASLYDLVLNLDPMNMEEACDVICSASRLRSFEFTNDAKRAIDNLALASRVKANLLMDEIVGNSQFEVTAEGGKVFIKGEIDNAAQAKRIARIVQGVHGVVEANLEALALTARI